MVGFWGFLVIKVSKDDLDFGGKVRYVLVTKVTAFSKTKLDADLPCPQLAAR